MDQALQTRLQLVPREAIWIASWLVEVGQNTRDWATLFTGNAGQRAEFFRSQPVWYKFTEDRAFITTCSTAPVEVLVDAHAI